MICRQDNALGDDIVGMTMRGMPAGPDGLLRDDGHAFGVQFYDWTNAPVDTAEQRAAWRCLEVLATPARRTSSVLLQRVHRVI
jgi:hypothetical protein